MSLVDEKLLKRVWTRLESRALSLVRDWPGGKPGEYLAFNQNNGSIFYTDADFDGYSAVGLLWLMYDWSGQDVYRRYALEGTRSFAPVANKLHTHTSIATYRTAGWGYELTGDETLRTMALKGTETFSRFWDEQNQVLGRRSGLDVWPVAVANMAGGPSVKDRYNIPQKPRERPLWATAVDWGGFWFEGLYWTAKYEPRYLEYAAKHCESYLRLGFVREDGSSHHVMRFNADTGEPEEFFTPQGYSVETTWSRGHAWILMQYAQAYEATGTELFLDTFLRCADYWVDHLPDDLIPYYDMSDPRIPHVPRDSCSAVIAMNAMIRVCNKNPQMEPKFKQVVGDIMQELYDFYLTPGGLMLHGSWGKSQEPLHERILHFGNLYLPDAVYMEMDPEAFARVRGY
jgi:unsaturated chondroitin disaccharide hydrolase